MALAADVLLRLARLGGASVAALQADGTAIQVHPHAETWYAQALATEDATTWGALYLEACAAKAAHWCLKAPWNDDAIRRSVIESEPLNGAPGARKYKLDAGSRAWWMSTTPGAIYLELKDSLGPSSPLLAF